MSACRARYNASRSCARQKPYDQTVVDVDRSRFIVKRVDDIRQGQAGQNDGDKTAHALDLAFLDQHPVAICMDVEPLNGLDGAATVGGWRVCTPLRGRHVVPHPALPTKPKDGILLRVMVRPSGFGTKDPHHFRKVRAPNRS